MPLYIVEATSSHKLYYLVNSEQKRADIEHIVIEKIADGTLEDFAQKWEGENIDQITKVTEEKYIAEFNRLNVGERSWSAKQKLSEAQNIDVKVKPILEDEI